MQNEIYLREATLNDVPILAEMNQQLIVDGRSKSKLTLTELEDRMRTWLADNRHAIIVERKNEIIGYMLYWQHPDEFYPYRNSIYVRQFFIQPSYRRRGIGQIAFDRIVSSYFANDAAITLDVIADNLEGKAFWERLGFQAYHTTMRREASV